MRSLEQTTQEVLDLAAKHFQLPAGSLTPGDDFFKKLGIDSLQTVDAQLFEKIVPGRKRSGGQLKVLRGQVEDFLCRLFKRAHRRVNLSSLCREIKFERPCFGHAMGKPSTQIQSSTSPWRMPMETASVRVEAPSFPRIEATWNFTV